MITFNINDGITGNVHLAVEMISWVLLRTSHFLRTAFRCMVKHDVVTSDDPTVVDHASVPEIVCLKMVKFIWQLVAVPTDPLYYAGCGQVRRSMWTDCPRTKSKVWTRGPIDATPTLIESAPHLVFVLSARWPRCNQLLEIILGTTHSD